MGAPPRHEKAQQHVELGLSLQHQLNRQDRPQQRLMVELERQLRDECL
jgi:hypothetical protein